ncbi:MAG: hypothetical protein ORN49_09700 [Rhodobacteraceae bacterium]|nr:hypothetical protein [Paracoccaceae bacterium]
MKRPSPLCTSAALAALFCATAAQADVTADQVWQDWKAHYAGMGQTITSGAENREGDVLVLKDVKFASTSGTTTSEGTIAELRLKELGDGTVEVTLSPEIPMVVHNKPAEGPASDLTAKITQTDAKMLVSGTTEAMDYAFTATDIGLSMDEAKLDGSATPMKMQITAHGYSGTSHVEKAAGYTVKWDYTAEGIDFAMAGADPEGKSTLNFSGKLNGLKGMSLMAIPNGVDMADLNAALQAGLSMEGSFDFGGGSYKLEGIGADGNFIADSSGGAGKLTLKMSKDGLAYGGESVDSKMALSGSSMPFPVEATIAQTALSMVMPVSMSDTAQPASLLLKIVDLGVSDSLWGLIDPTAKLPHDPATLVLDLSGSLKPLVNLFDAKETAAFASAATGGAGSPKLHFEASEAKINQLQLKAVGAELTGTGAVTLDNAATPPKPVGGVDLNLTGANKLMDNLVAMGLVPQEQMMGMFAVPAGEDAYTSKIEFKEDGGIYVNGQRIQ